MRAPPAPARRPPPGWEAILLFANGASALITVLAALGTSPERIGGLGAALYVFAGVFGIVGARRAWWFDLSPESGIPSIASQACRHVSPPDHALLAPPLPGGRSTRRSCNLRTGRERSVRVRSLLGPREHPPDERLQRPRRVRRRCAALRQPDIARAHERRPLPQRTRSCVCTASFNSHGVDPWALAAQAAASGSWRSPPWSPAAAATPPARLLLRPSPPPQEELRACAQSSRRTRRASARL